ncbi:RNA polymerase sigma-70 factor [Arcticibacter sp. MXS-1]|uniref:RNA polymerase sigma-70 factor n=1 Tax=Arcticibacter sp. MXS-1 TaxID=3341726 RepID=UPI0035A98DE2
MEKIDSLSDERLVELLQRGEQKAFAEIYNRYWRVLYSSAYRRVKHAEASEEIVQDVFTKLWLNRVNLNIRTSTGAYLLTAVKYQVINYLEKEYVRRNYHNRIAWTAPDAVNSTEEEVHLRDLTRNLKSAVNSLPSKCRSVFTLSRMEYKTNREIAEALGISEKTVENQISRALKKIRVIMANCLLSVFLMGMNVVLDVFDW